MKSARERQAKSAEKEWAAGAEEYEMIHREKLEGEKHTTVTRQVN